MSTPFSQTTNSPSQLTYRVAAIQYEPVLGEKETNLENLLTLTDEAASQGARIIVLPKLATVGHCWVSREEIAPFVEPVPGPTTTRFVELACNYDAYIAFSLPEVDPQTQMYYNTCVLVGPQGIVGTYRQLHAAITDTRWSRDGDQGIAVWDTPLGRLSALMCMDLTYFEAARIAALRGADVLLCPVNWVQEKAPSSTWMARAFENHLYMIVANRHGNERGQYFSGGSCILEPGGAIQAYQELGNGIVYGQIDSTHFKKCWESSNTVLGDPIVDRRPDEYANLAHNSYLWEPLRYHGLYELGELPTGQLSCTGIVQMDLTHASTPMQTHTERIQMIRDMLQSMMRDNAPAIPDVLVLPELVLPGPVPPLHPDEQKEQYIQHFQQGAIEIPGPETDELVAIANVLQVSIVLGVAEHAGEQYYNTVLLIDPEGVYGVYRKLHLTQQERLWATPGNLGLPTFDTPTGRIGLATGYDVLFPETLRVLANKGTDLVCAPTMLAFPEPMGRTPQVEHNFPFPPEEYNSFHFLIWRVRAAEHNVYLAIANWYGEKHGVHANGLSGIYAPGNYPLTEVVANEDELGLMMMTIDTREQRTGRRTTRLLDFSPGDMLGSLTGELEYSIQETIPGNVVRSKPMLRKRLPFWYLDLVVRRP